MAWTNPYTWTTGEVVTKALLDTHIRDNENFLKINVALGTPTGLTVAAGIIVKTQSHHAIAPAAGIVDDLDTINGGTNGDVLFVRAVAGNTIILKNGTGNIINPGGGDVTISETLYAELAYNGANWIIVGGGSSASLAAHLVAYDHTKIHSQNTDTDLDSTFEATFTKNADTNVKANGWVIDEDDMVSNLDTKVPTQQSVKAYVAAHGGSILTGTSFPASASAGDLFYRTDLNTLYEAKVDIGNNELDYQVNASLHDTQYSYAGGAMHSTTNYDGAGLGNLWPTMSENRRGVGLIFTGVTIPDGMTISAASIQFKANENRAVDNCNVKISGEQGTVHAHFDGNYANDYTNRTKTTALVTWSNIPHWTADTWYDSQDIKSIIQELIDDYNGLTSEDITLFCQDEDSNSSLDAFRTGHSYDTSTTEAPKLHIEYTTGDESWVEILDIDHTTAADPHTVYRLESADHSHQTTGAQAGQLDHGLALTAASLLDADHPASAVSIPNGLGTPIYDDMADFLNQTQSSGRLTGGVITAHGGEGSVNISEMEGMIHTANTQGSPLIYFKKAAYHGLALIDDKTNYIILTYSAGLLTYTPSATRPAYNTYNAFVIGRAWCSGTTVETLTTGQNIYDEYGRIQDRMFTKYGGMDRASGAVISAHATPLRLQCTGSIWYFGNTLIDLSAATPDTFFVWYRHAAGAWTKTSALTLFSEVITGTHTVYTTYQNGTDLTVLGGTNYGVYWVFMCPEGHLNVVLGTDNYANANTAGQATVPASLPSYCVDWARLIGKVIIKHSAAAFSSVESAFTTTFALSAATDHGSLSGLGDDDHTQYLLNSVLTERGSIIFRDASAPAELKHGTDGQVLTSKGDGADPIWATGGTTDPMALVWAIVFGG